MLNHFVVGPTASNRYLVAYRTPGCSVPTCVSDCSTPEAAGRVSERLNRQQVQREKELQQERAARGLHGVYPDLGSGE